MDTSSINFDLMLWLAFNQTIANYESYLLKEVAKLASRIEKKKFFLGGPPFFSPPPPFTKKSYANILPTAFSLRQTKVFENHLA